MKKRVAHFVESFPASGENYVYSQVRDTARFQGDLYSEYQIISPYSSGLSCQSYLKLTNSPFINRGLRAIRNRILPGQHNKMLCRWYEGKMQARPPDLIHAHFGTTGFKVLDLKKKLGVPLLVTFYGVDISQVLREPKWRARYRELVQAADKLIVLFDEGVDRLVELGADRKKISVWDIGIPLDEYTYRKPRTDSDGVKFLITARFVEKKGYFVLLQAFRKVLDRHPASSLTMIGNGPLKQDIQQRIQELGLADKTHLVDTQNAGNFFDLFKQALNEHDLFVLPSIVSKGGDDEGGPPVVITNAMAVGLPVISTPIGGISRAIIHGETGYLTTSGDAQGLSEQMIYCIENRQSWNSISLGGRSLAEERFNIKKQLDQVEDFYQEVLGKR